MIKIYYFDIDSYGAIQSKEFSDSYIKEITKTLKNPNLEIKKIVNTNAHDQFVFSKIEFSNVAFVGRFEFDSCTLYGCNLMGADILRIIKCKLDCCVFRIPDMLTTYFKQHGTNQKIRDSIVRDMMIIDCQSHPKPKAFDLWKSTYGAECPYGDYYMRPSFRFSPDDTLFPGSEVALATVVNQYDLFNRLMKVNGNKITNL